MDVDHDYDEGKDEDEDKDEDAAMNALQPAKDDHHYQLCFAFFWVFSTLAVLHIVLCPLPLGGECVYCLVFLSFYLELYSSTLGICG